jgi:tRNA(fMet)-specific endonuclease VapC
MMYLVDTDWIVAYLKGRSEATQLLSGLAPAGLAISLITYAEIYEGIYFGQNPTKQEQGFLSLLTRVTVLPLTEESMKRFATLRGELRAQGLLIGDLDLLIAATAIQHHLVLVTRNLRHFQRIPGLSLYSSNPNN